MPLHIDYRPNDLKNFIGNKGLIKSLESILTREKDIPHSILIQGPTGCGKTTLGRIIKKYLECADEDFIELNASNNRGIDTAREIQTKMFYKPLAGKSRVYLIDEVHQTTKDFQNAMLKALEDSPPHAYFILCTTEPEKLLRTVKNRCHTFEVSSLSDKEMSVLLTEVAGKEEVDFTDEQFDMIIEAAAGCPRQALVILDQVIDVDIDEREEAIQKIVISESTQVKELCQALLKKQSWKKIKDIIKNIEGEPEQVRRAVIGYMSAVALNSDKGNTQAALIFECFKEPFFNTGKAGLTFAAFEVIS